MSLMEINKILVIEMNKVAMKEFNIKLNTCLENTEETFDEFDRDCIKKDIRVVREYSVENLMKRNIKVFKDKEKETYDKLRCF